MRHRTAVLGVLTVVTALCAAAPGFDVTLTAQGRGRSAVQPEDRGATPGRDGAAAQPSPRDAAPIDLTGYWVSIVNEDWRWRMVTPPKGDYASVPLTAAARAIADAWDAAQDGRCEAYGAAGIMRIPTRLHIAWESPTVLRLEFDAGQQIRRLVFDPARKPSVRATLQGHSVAEWERAAAGRGARGGEAPPQGGSAKVVTTHMTGGWLRRNGVPYSADAVLTEHFDRFTSPTGDEWLVVTSIVSDPKYLSQDFVTSTHFRKEADGSAFSPTPCRAS